MLVVLVIYFFSFHVKQMAMGATFSKLSGMRHLRMISLKFQILLKILTPVLLCR